MQIDQQRQERHQQQHHQQKKQKKQQAVNFAAPGTTAPNALATSSYAFGGDIVAVNGKLQ
jgi:hypothetical protein